MNNSRKGSVDPPFTADVMCFAQFSAIDTAISLAFFFFKLDDGMMMLTVVDCWLFLLIDVSVLLLLLLLMRLPALVWAIKMGRFCCGALCKLVTAYLHDSTPFITYVRIHNTMIAYAHSRDALDSFILCFRVFWLGSDRDQMGAKHTASTMWIAFSFF